MKQKISILSTLLLLLLGSNLFAQIPTNGLVAYYPFNGNANDMSGNGNNGTVNGATLCPDRFGNANSAYSLNGNSNYIEIPSSSSFNFSTNLEFSFGGWVLLYQAPSNAACFIGKDGNVNCQKQAFAIDFYSDNLSLAGVHCASPNCWMASSKFSYSSNNWYHYFVTVNQNNLKLYVNGSLVEDSTFLSVLWDYDGRSFHFGAYSSMFSGLGDFLGGKIDDIRFYNRALTPCEVTFLFNENCATTKPVASNIIICGSGTGNFVATGGTDFNKWYDSPWGCNAIDSGTIFTTPYIAATDTFYVSNTVGCESSRDTVIAFVHPLPTVSLGNFSTVCIDASPFALSGGNPAGGTYSGPGIVNDTLHPFIAGPATHNITYHFTDSNSCTDSSSNTIIVNDLPAVTLNNFSMVCEYTPSFTLSGGSPIGGIYSGTGINLGTFDPAIAGAGTYPIVYHYTDGNNCSNSDTASILVSNCTGVNEIDPASILEINPNPNSGRFTITIIQPESGSVQLQITNAIGQLIKEETFETTSGQNSHIIDLGEIVSGTYFLNLFDGENNFKKTIMIKH